MGRRITRKQLKEDEFVSTMDSVIIWVKDRWKPFAAGLGAACALILVWWFAGMWTDSRAQEASYVLREAVAVYETAQTAGPDGDLDAAKTKLQEVVDDYGRSNQGDMARLYLSRLDMMQGDVESARSALVKLADKRRGDPVGRLATLDLVHLRVDSGQGAEVAAELQAMVVGRDDRLPRDLALFELGEVYFKEQDTDQAREYLQKLVDEFPESPYVSQAQQRLAELG